jgi:hypothetical protein
MIVRIFQILSFVFAVAAGFFWWSSNFDYAFAGVVLAICSFFLSMRFQMKARNQAVAESRAADSSNESD